MSEELFTFDVQCAHCPEQFIVRFPLVDKNAHGSGEQTVKCLHCNTEQKIPLERKYMQTETLIRGIKLEK